MPDNCNEIERNNRISAEFQRISIYFEDLAENQKRIVMPLIQNAAFMRVTLDDLQKIIAEQGPVEAYQNGRNQHGVKQSAALQSYNALVKNYASIIKSLNGYLPPMKKLSAYEQYLQSKAEEEEETEEERKARLEQYYEDFVSLIHQDEQEDEE